MKIVLIIALALLVGCKDETAINKQMEFYCETDTKKERASFILECLNNANPKSDEEPEDWIHECEDMSNELYCEERLYNVTRFKPGGSYWRDIKKELVEK